jgi:nucleoside permease NupC
MEQSAVTPPWLDKGLWVAVLTPVLLFLNQKFGFALDAMTIVGMVLPVVAYIVGHKWKSGTIVAAQLAAKAAAGDPAPTLSK